jgi:hypothetical protein
MNDRIKGNPAEPKGRVVAKLMRCPAVRCFVDGDGEEEDEQADDERDQVHF